MKTRPSVDIYEITRTYLGDSARYLAPHIFNTLEGWRRARDVAKLATCSAAFGDIALHDVTTCKILLQVESFFRKNSSLEVGIDKHEAAMSSFIDAELRCFYTNERLSNLSYASPECEFSDEILTMRSHIQELLGDFNTFLEELPQRVRLTSGATLTRPRVLSQPIYKLVRNPYCSSRAVPYIRALYNYFGYKAPRCRPTDVNRVISVPKSWKTNRTIACEPEGNIPLQLAFDSYVKDKLRAWGIDLSDQTRNQVLARQGSEGGDNPFTTIDLSAASDTVSRAIITLLFPKEWEDYLEDVRSRLYCYEGKFRSYEKFSSMGNGSTFAIETLIFAAACRAVGSREFVVYGDDIVIRQQYSGRLLSLLDYLGFIPNREKSFTSGFFRESCGKYYCRGQDVTPFFVRRTTGGNPLACHNINGLVAVSDPYGKLWELLRNYTEDFGLPLVPVGSDTMSGVHIPVSDCYKIGSLRFRKRTSIVSVRQYSAVTKRHRSPCVRALTLWYFVTRNRYDVPSMLEADYLKHSSRGDLARHGLIVASKHFESSWVTDLVSRYRLKWVRWVAPTAGATLQHYCWSDYLGANALK